MSIKNKIIATILGLSLVVMVVPAGASAALTSAQVSAIISLLQSFGADAATIANVNASLTGGTPVTPPATGSCAGIFTRNLTVGSTGADVTCLQTILNVSPQSGYFGPLTLAAVKAYQTANGLTPANQVGPLTRAKLNGGVVVNPGYPPVNPPITGGAEGSITVTKSVSPISGAEMAPGASNVAVTGVDVKATGSNVMVNRLDVTFTMAAPSTGCNVRPWTNISGLTVSDGSTSKTVAVTASSVLENTIGSSYTVRAEGLNMLVPMGTTKKLTVSVNAAPALPTGATTCTSTIQLGSQAVRGTDGAGVSQYSSTTALASSTFIVKTGTDADTEISVSSDNPKARNVIVGENGQTDNVVLLKFSVKAKNNDVVLRTIRIQANSSDTVATVMPTVKLLDGSTELAATSTAATSTFGDLSVVIAKDTTKTFTVVGTFAKQSGNYSEGTWVNATVAAADVLGEDASNFATADPTGATTDPANAYAFLKAPTFTLVSQSIVNVPGTSGSSSQAATAVIRFNVTANSGDIYIKNVDSVAASSGIVTQAQDSATGTIASTFTTNATAGTNAWKVTSGDTKYFEITTQITNESQFVATGDGYFAGVEVLNVKWATTDSSVDPAGYTIQTWGVSDLETGKVFLNQRG